MARVPGRVAYFSLVANDISQYVTSVDFPRSADQHDVTGLGDTYRKRIAGFKDANIRLRGHWDDGTGGTSIDTLLDGALGPATPQAWQYVPAGNTTGKRRYSGTASAGAGGLFGTTYNITASVDGAVDWEFEGVLDGAPTRDTVP